jgi:hypothetical protein
VREALAVKVRGVRQAKAIGSRIAMERLAPKDVLAPESSAADV